MRRLAISAVSLAIASSAGALTIPGATSFYGAIPDLGGLTLGAADEIVRAQGELRDGGGDTSFFTPIGAEALGEFEMVSAGDGDLRETPGTATLTTAAGAATANAVRVNQGRNVDVTTGRPVAGASAGSSNNDTPPTGSSMALM